MLRKATLTSWLKEVGDTIEEDEAVLEIATDKVDSEVPSEVTGVLVEKLFDVDDVIQVGQTIAIIEIAVEGAIPEISILEEENEVIPTKEIIAAVAAPVLETVSSVVQSSDSRFYSPLVKNIAVAEGISQQELDQISGTGKDGRVTKNDILKFVENRSTQPLIKETTTINKEATQKESKPVSTTPVSVNGGDEIIEMTRMGKLIAHHMVESVQTSAHVQSFIEADVTNIWNWRKKVKDGFTKREGENLTFTPIFLEAVAKALKDFPMLNISVDGDKIIKRKNINLRNGCCFSRRKPDSSGHQKCRSIKLGRHE